MMAESVTIAGYGGDEIEAYLAGPTGAGSYPGVVVIHHMPGYDRSTKEIVRTFAVYGYAAVCPNLHYRYAPGAKATDAAAAAIEAGGVPDEQCIGDVSRAVRFLRAQPTANGRVGVIGYCSGGRQAYLAGCTVSGIDAVVSNYGGGVVAKPEELTERQPKAPIDFTKDMKPPILLLFGIEVKRPSPEDAKKTIEALKQHGKTYETHTYENAGHAFFAVDREQYRVHAAVDGWKRVFAFFGKHLGGKA